MRTMDGLTSGGREAQAELVLLLDGVARREPAALGELYRRTSAKLFGIALRLLGDSGEAQDVLQESYLQVWRSAAGFDPARASAVTWLAVIARNKAIDRLRQRKPGSSADLAEAEAIADDSPSAFDRASGSDEAARLAACLERLDERARALIRAAFLDGRSYAQLANSEAVPLGTMKSWIRRGLLSLRGCLEA